MTLPRIKATYAIIDVMAGRKKLAKHIAKHGPVRVLIEAEIDEYGRDDGDRIPMAGLGQGGAAPAVRLDPAVPEAA